MKINSVLVTFMPIYGHIMSLLFKCDIEPKSSGIISVVAHFGDVIQWENPFKNGDPRDISDDVFQLQNL